METSHVIAPRQEMIAYETVVELLQQRVDQIAVRFRSRLPTRVVAELKPKNLFNDDEVEALIRSISEFGW